eukprot:12104577-Alexandrium_andersonii.AAC.1
MLLWIWGRPIDDIESDPQRCQVMTRDPSGPMGRSAQHCQAGRDSRGLVPGCGTFERWDVGTTGQCDA